MGDNPPQQPPAVKAVLFTPTDGGKPYEKLISCTSSAQQEAIKQSLIAAIEQIAKQY